MGSPVEFWRDKSDEEILEAVTSLDDYTDQARKVIVEESLRRQLNITPLVEAVVDLRQAPARSGVFKRCATCDEAINFGGKREGELWFCNEECRSIGVLLALSRQIPDETVNDRLMSLYQGNCPRCSGPGPVDFQKSYTVWSAILFTFWRRHDEICCHSCGNRARVKRSIFSLLLGWWGVPLGPVLTPVQIIRNLASFRRDTSGRPSERLERMIRIQMARETAQAPASAVASE